MSNEYTPVSEQEEFIIGFIPLELRPIWRVLPLVDKKNIMLQARLYTFDSEFQLNAFWYTRINFKDIKYIRLAKMKELQLL